MAEFDKSLRKTLNLEGDYADHPLDPGGKTRFGITEATARAYGYTGEMCSLPLDLAKDIYRKGYWDSARLTEVPSQLLADNIFDCGVNCGVMTSVKFLQRALNVMNGRQKKWEDIEVSGVLDTVTLKVLKKALSTKAMETALVKLFNVLRGEYYIRIAERREANEVFMLGWVLHRLQVEVRE